MQKNEENTTHVFYQIKNIGYHIEFPHDVKECIPIHSFELNPTTLPTNNLQLTEEHDQAQNNILEVHSLTPHSSYKREFDVKTYIVDLVEYMLCSLHSLTFQRNLQISTPSITHFNANIFSKQIRIKLKFKQNKDIT